MNKTIYLIVILFVSLSSLRLSAGDASCSANFTYTIDYSVSSFTYQFQDQSTAGSAIVSREWSFGDGSMSIRNNPEHQYLSEGTYVVSLEITCSDGTTDIKYDTLEVQKVLPPSCAAFFTWLNDSNTTVSFTDHSVSPGDTIVSWNWDFGDNTFSSQKNPSHTYSVAGSYIVSLSIYSTGGCSDIYYDTVLVGGSSPQCVASFTFKADSVSGNPNTIFFYDKSSAGSTIVKWRWNFADGDTSINQNPVHIFPYAGVYDVSLEIETQNGCKSSVHYPIQVGNPQKYNVWGRVYLGNLTTDKCIAYLYKEYKNGYIVPVDTVRLTSVSDTLGVYYFYQILEGVHKVKVLLPQTSNYYGDYAPTYFGDNLFWDKTNTLNLFQDIALANVQMAEINQTSGTNQISGALYYGTNALQKEGVQIMMLNASGQVYAYTYTDMQGHYVFDDVPSGTFYIYAELTGLYAIPGQVATTNFDTLGFVDIILTKTQAVTSIKDKAEESDNNCQIYPNPVQSVLYLQFRNPISSNAYFEVYNNLGVRLVQGRLSNVTISSVNVESLDPGIYFIRVFLESGQIIDNKRFIKKP